MTDELKRDGEREPSLQCCLVRLGEKLRFKYCHLAATCYSGGIMSNLEMVVTSVVGSIGGAALVVGALAAWLGQVWKGRLDRMEEASMQIDVDLRQRRIETYQLLWGITSLLPRWPREESVTYEQIRGFSVQLKDWYFQEGGMYLSTSSREAYTDLQDVLIKFSGADYTGVLRSTPTDDYETVRKKCSALRSCLAADIQSRRESPDKK